MNAEQKQRAKDALQKWHSRNDDSPREYQSAELMTALLQELVDAPEPEPFGYFKPEPFGWTDCAETDDGAIALYELPPAPSVPDGWQPIETAPKDNKRSLFLARFNDDGTIQAFDYDGTWQSERESWELPQVYYYWATALGKVEEPTHWMYEPEWFSKLNSAQQPAPPADLARDAARYRWLRNPTTDPALVIDKRVGPSFWDYEYRAGDELDAAIDAAIEREKMKGGEA